MKNDTFEYEILAPDRHFINVDRVIGLDNAIAAGRQFCEDMDARGGYMLSKGWRMLSPEELRGHTLVIRFGNDGCEYVGNLAELLERDKAHGAFKELTDKCLEVVRETIREEFERERQTSMDAMHPDAFARSLDRDRDEPEP